MFNSVEVSSPPNTTMAIGLWISLPDLSPLNTSGIKANAEVSAVIRIGFSRSIEPCNTVSCNGVPAFCRCWYFDMSNIPLRVAIPNSVINPIMEGMLITPEVKKTAERLR